MSATSKSTGPSFRSKLLVVFMVAYCFAVVGGMHWSSGSNFQHPDAPTLIQPVDGHPGYVMKKGLLFTPVVAVSLNADAGVVFDAGQRIRLLGDQGGLHVEPMGSTAVKVTFADETTPVEGKTYTVPIDVKSDRTRLLLSVTPAAEGPTRVNVQQALDNSSYVLFLFAMIPPGILALLAGVSRRKENGAPVPAAAEPQT